MFAQVCWAKIGLLFFTVAQIVLLIIPQCSMAEIKRTPTGSLCVHNVGSAVSSIFPHLLSLTPPSFQRVFFFFLLCSLHYLWLHVAGHLARLLLRESRWMMLADMTLISPTLHSHFIFTGPCTGCGVERSCDP